jgi:hypothetical protein
VSGVDHPNLVQACEELAEAVGGLEAVHALPEAANAYTCVSSNDRERHRQGTHQGRPVDWSWSHAGGCQMEADTAGLFLV